MPEYIVTTRHNIRADYTVTADTAEEAASIIADTEILDIRTFAYDPRADDIGTTHDDLHDITVKPAPPSPKS